MLVFLQTLVRGYCGFEVFDMALIVDRGVLTEVLLTEVLVSKQSPVCSWYTTAPMGCLRLAQTSIDKSKDCKHATCNMRHATCNMQHATCKMQDARQDIARKTCNIQHTTQHTRHITQDTRALLHTHYRQES